MIKVMHLLNTGSYSGAENVVITIIEATKDKVASTYVSLDGPIRDYLNSRSINFYAVSKLKVSEIKRAIKEVNPDIIHAHDFTAGVICSLTGTIIPIINHLHNNAPWIKRVGIKSVVYAVSCYRYKRILTVSDAVMKEFVFGKQFSQKTIVVSNPVDIEKITKQVQECKFPKYDIAYLGRLTKAKNPQLFLNVIKEIKIVIGNVRAIMIGDGELRDEIEDIITKENLQENVIMVGFQNNPYTYLNQSRMLLMPSSWEGFGLAAIEALALGKPVICSNAGGLTSIVNDSCGKICLSVDEYVSSIIRLIQDDEYYNTLSRGALARSNELSNMKVYTDKILNCYDKVLLDGVDN